MSVENVYISVEILRNIKGKSMFWFLNSTKNNVSKKTDF